MFSKVLAAAIVMASVSAHAVESEFFYQSKGGQSDLTVRAGLLSSSVKPKGGTETKTTGLVETGVLYEYGINEQFAIEGALLYTSVEDDATPKAKIVGLQDPKITFKGTSAMGPGNLRYGLGVGLALQKGKVDGDETSAASGGFSFSPYVGMDAEAGGGTVGGRLIYNILLERTIEVQGQTSDSKVKDGNNFGLSAFYEAKITDAVLGGALNYVNHTATKDENGNELDAAHSTWGASVYSVLPFGAWELIPRLDYDFSHSEMDKYDVAIVSIAGRFKF